MKTLMIIPALSTTLFNLPTRATAPFEYMSISPLYLSGESTIVFSTKSSNVSFIVFLKNNKYSSAKLIQETITSPGTYTFSYDNRYTLSANKIYFCYKTTGSYIYSSEIDSNVASAKTEYITDNNDIVSDRSILSINSNLTWTSRKIRYSFNNFDGLYMPDYYHKIDLSDFEIILNKEDHYFFSCNPSLVIKNVNHAFDDVLSGGNQIEFYLKLVENDTKYHFKLQNNLYVHQTSLHLSSTKYSGYVQTKHIYLPRNDMRNQDKYQAYFYLKNFGIDRDSVYHTLELRALKNTVGDCRNSEYCVQKLFK